MIQTKDIYNILYKLNCTRSRRKDKFESDAIQFCLRFDYLYLKYVNCYLSIYDFDDNVNKETALIKCNFALKGFSIRIHKHDGSSSV